MLLSAFLQPLKSGAEASPFADTEWGTVYKLFPLHRSGGLGKTFELHYLDDPTDLDMTTVDATLLQTMEKLMVLHDAGACPTEIIGIDSMGEYLVAKQALAKPYVDLEADREVAVQQLKSVPCLARLKRQAWIFWRNECAWILSDLHKGNIMRSVDDTPTIIDALLAPLPPELIQANRLLSEHVEDATALAMGRPLPERRGFDSVNDDEL